MAIPVKDVPNASVGSRGDAAGSYPQAVHGNSMPSPPNAARDRRNGSFPLAESHGVIHIPNQSPPKPGHSGGQG